MFTPLQLLEVKSSSLSRVMCNNGDNIDHVTRDAFILPQDQDPPFIPCDELPDDVNLRVWTECCQGK